MAKVFIGVDPHKLLATIQFAQQANHQPSSQGTG